MTDPLPFLSDAVMDEAMAALERQRDEYSIDSMYRGTGLDREDVTDILSEEAHRAAGDLSLLVVDGRIPVFREIVAPADWDHVAETRPHAYWSHSAELAHAHWAEGPGVRWLLTGSVAVEDVDQAASIALNANPALVGEGEIRLLAGRTVVVDSVERRPHGHSHPYL